MRGHSRPARTALLQPTPIRSETRGVVAGRSCRRRTTRVNLKHCDFDLLKISNHLKQIPRLRIPFRTEHSHQTLWRLGKSLPQSDESQRAIDVFAQDRLGRLQISRHHVADRLPQKLTPKVAVRQLFLDRLSKAPCQGHLFLPLSFLVLSP